MSELWRGLYVILDEESYGEALIPTTALLLSIGVRLFQYRAKAGVALATVQQLMALAALYKALIIVNDDLAAARSADGLHLGQDDLAGRTVQDIRLALPGKYLGISCHTPSQAQAVSGADYLGVGPFRQTQSKQVARSPLGLQGISEIVASTALPVCAIGGITVADIAPLRAKGVAMVAVIRDLAKAADPASTAQAYRAAFGSSLH